MNDTAAIDRTLQDAAEWLISLPAPTHLQLAAAGELLIESARVMRGQAALADAMADAPNVRQGNWRPRPGGQPDLPDGPGLSDHYRYGFGAQTEADTAHHLASVSRETSAPSCDADWGSATESQRCVLAPGHLGLHLDRTGHDFDGERPDVTAEVHH